MVQMHSGLRKIVVVMFALCITTAGITWQSLVGKWLTEELSLRARYLGLLGPNTIYRFGDEFTQLSHLGLCLIVGLSFIAIFWDKSTAGQSWSNRIVDLLRFAPPYLKYQVFQRFSLRD